MIAGCKHEWLIPHGNRTTCTKCSRDGWISLDMEAENNINALNEYFRSLKEEISYLRHSLNLIKDLTAKTEIDNKKQYTGEK